LFGGPFGLVARLAETMVELIVAAIQIKHQRAELAGGDEFDRPSKRRRCR
jgi:hypothetical protein